MLSFTERNAFASVTAMEKIVMFLQENWEQMIFQVPSGLKSVNLGNDASFHTLSH